MKKIKNNLNIIIAFFVGLIISFLGTTYAASQILASDVNFTPRDSSWNVQNADAAINDLYYKVPGIPTGTILSIMGKTAPTGYLICDGKEYNISTHPNLANYIKDQFGSYNYFGGDGTTTFKVPDLRGEFLRGTGTNTATGFAGANVGSHQAPTFVPNIIADQDRIEYISANTANDGKGSPKNYDAIYNSATTKQYRLGATSSVWDGNTSSNTHYSIRPTNTSVLYIIKY